MKTVIILLQIQILLYMTLRMIMIPIMSLVDMNKRNEYERRSL